MLLLRVSYDLCPRGAPWGPKSRISSVFALIYRHHDFLPHTPLLGLLRWLNFDFVVHYLETRGVELSGVSPSRADSSSFHLESATKSLPEGEITPIATNEAPALEHIAAQGRRRSRCASARVNLLAQVLRPTPGSTSEMLACLHRNYALQFARLRERCDDT
jgi:hypothetical protein